MSELTNPQVPLFTQAQGHLSGIVDRYSKELAEIDDTKGKYIALAEFVITVRHDVRMYAIIDEPDLKALWEMVRKSDVAFDFIMLSVNELILSLGAANFIKLTEEIATAYTSHAAAGVIDPDTIARLPELDVLNELLANNSWVIPIYILNTMSIIGFLTKFNKIKDKPNGR